MMGADAAVKGQVLRLPGGLFGLPRKARLSGLFTADHGLRFPRTISDKACSISVRSVRCGAWDDAVTKELPPCSMFPKPPTF